MGAPNYVSPRALAKALGFSESSVKRWTDDGRLSAERTAGGHRRIARSEAIRFVRENGLSLVDPGSLGLPNGDASPVTAGRLDGIEPALAALLEDGSGVESRALVLSSYLEGQSIAALVDGPIRGAMAQIGALWKEPGGAASIAIEHRATDICSQTLYELESLLPSIDSSSPVAVGGAPEGDPFALPTLGAALTLREAGYRAVNLGPNTPLRAIEAAANTLRADLIWVSVSRPLDRERGLESRLRRLGAGLEGSNREVVVGGRSAETILTGDCSAVRRLSTMRDLSRLAESRLSRMSRRA
ncbi:MAG: helix-turn-helix domain-containing protein [Phycisphaerales bacterium]